MTLADIVECDTGCYCWMWHQLTLLNMVSQTSQDLPSLVVLAALHPLWLSKIIRGLPPTLKFQWFLSVIIGEEKKRTGSSTGIIHKGTESPILRVTGTMTGTTGRDAELSPPGRSYGSSDPFPAGPSCVPTGPGVEVREREGEEEHHGGEW